MKKTILGIGASLGLAVILLTPTTGCVTTNGTKVLDTNVVAKITPALETAVAGAVVYGYTRDHNSILYIDAVKTALQEFLLSSDMSPSALQAKIYALPIKELKTPEAQLIITPILSAYKAFGEQYVSTALNNQEGWKMLIRALVAGVDDGLAGVHQIQAGATPAH
jgi:hypothetical protein